MFDVSSMQWDSLSWKIFSVKNELVAPESNSIFIWIPLTLAQIVLGGKNLVLQFTLNKSNSLNVLFNVISIFLTLTLLLHTDVKWPSLAQILHL